MNKGSRCGVRHRGQHKGAVIQAALAGLALAGLVACNTADPVVVPTFSPTPTLTPTPTVQVLAEFPIECSDMLGGARLNDIVSVPFAGSNKRVYAGPLPDIGRTQRLTCDYGIVKDKEPAVSLTLNEYVTEEAALDRLSLTVEAATDQAIEAAPVVGLPGYLLSDSDTVSAVLSTGNRTAVVTLRRGLVPEPAEKVVLEGLIASMLNLPGPTLVQTPEPSPTPEEPAIPTDENVDPDAFPEPSP